MRGASRRSNQHDHRRPQRRRPDRRDAPDLSGDAPERSGHRRGLVLLAVALGVVAVWVLRGRHRRVETGEKGVATSSRSRSLHYPVALGQDPAAALATLRLHGYDARLHTGGTSHEIEIRAADGGYVDRERARDVLQRSSLDMAGHGSLDTPVRFADE